MFNELSNEEMMEIDGGGVAYDVGYIIGYALEKGYGILDLVAQFGTEIIHVVYNNPELWFLL